MSLRKLTIAIVSLVVATSIVAWVYLHDRPHIDPRNIWRADSIAASVVDIPVHELCVGVPEEVATEVGSKPDPSDILIMEAHGIYLTLIFGADGVELNELFMAAKGSDIRLDKEPYPASSDVVRAGGESKQVEVIRVSFAETAPADDRIALFFRRDDGAFQTIRASSPASSLNVKLAESKEVAIIATDSLVRAGVPRPIAERAILQAQQELHIRSLPHLYRLLTLDVPATIVLPDPKAGVGPSAHVDSLREVAEAAVLISQRAAFTGHVSGWKLVKPRGNDSWFMLQRQDDPRNSSVIVFVANGKEDVVVEYLLSREGMSSDELASLVSQNFRTGEIEQLVVD